VQASRDLFAECAWYNYLPSYSLDLNPIAEFFAKLKTFVRQPQKEYAENATQEFDSFLGWCVDMVGARDCSAQGHFRHVGVVVEGVGM
jgi:transposase